MPSDDPRRVVVIDPATDSVTTIIGKASAAPGVGELRERIVASMRAAAPTGGYELALADAALRVILGDSEAPS